MIDSYLWGATDRISPEAPVPIVHLTKKEKRLGGAANVALNIKNLGATPYLLSVIGNDAEADTFVQLIEKETINSEYIIKDSSRTTTIKHRVISGFQHLLRIDEENINDISDEINSVLIEKFKKLIKIVDVVVFQDYDKGVLNAKNITTFIGICKAESKASIVDPKKKNFDLYKKVDLFKPNLKELREGLNISILKNNKQSIIDGVNKLKSIMNVENVLLTLSENGIYFDINNERGFLETKVRKIADVSGAGDTVISIASLCFALKINSLQIAELSNLGGGLVCEQPGVVSVTNESLVNALKII